MRGAIIALLLAAGAAARDLRAREDRSTATPTNDPALDIPKFRLVSPSEALSSLSAKAHATPSAVRIVPGVPLSLDAGGLVHDVVQTGVPVTDSAVETHIPNPEVPPSRREAAPASKVDARADAAADASCTNPTIVYEWSSLSTADQQGFTAAIKCLFSQPARSGLPGVQNRWDDLVAIHQIMNPTIHGVGQFLPWHRYFMWIFEQELRNTCGYTGDMTWWDETKNAGDFNAAAPFTEDYFGHMPDGNVVCITSGQFANTDLHIGPASSNTDHCLSRGCNEQTSASVTSSFVSTCNSYNDFNDMQDCSDYGPHGYGHDAIGGVMGDVQSSPGDPAFFLHHGFINRNWRIWQRTDPDSRTYAIGGDTTQNCGSSCTATTLDYTLTSLGFYPNVTVDQVMDTQGGFLCYHYDY